MLEHYRMKLLIAVFTAVFAFTFSDPASALMVKIPVEQLVKQAENIVLGTVIDEQAYKEDNEIYTNFQIKNTGFLGNIGKPQLPIISKIIAVPRTDVSIEIINTKSETKKVGKIYPAQTPQTDNLEKYDFII